MKTNIVVAALLFLCFGCTSQRTEELTQQQKDQIKKEVVREGPIVTKSVQKV